MVVAAATDVAVLNGRLVRHGLRAVGPVKIVAQDRSDRTVATGANVDAALAGRLDAFGTPGTHQSQDAETGPEALFGVRLGMQDLLNQGGCGRANYRRLTHQPCRRPVSVTPVRARHVFGDCRMSPTQGTSEMPGDAGAAVEP